MHPAATEGVAPLGNSHEAANPTVPGSGDAQVTMKNQVVINLPTTLPEKRNDAVNIAGPSSEVDRGLTPTVAGSNVGRSSCSGNEDVKVTARIGGARGVAFSVAATMTAAMIGSDKRAVRTDDDDDDESNIRALMAEKDRRRAVRSHTADGPPSLTNSKLASPQHTAPRSQIPPPAQTLSTPLTSGDLPPKPKGPVAPKPPAPPRAPTPPRAPPTPPRAPPTPPRAPTPPPLPNKPSPTAVPSFPPIGVAPTPQQEAARDVERYRRLDAQSRTRGPSTSGSSEANVQDLEDLLLGVPATTLPTVQPEWLEKAQPKSAVKQPETVKPVESTPASASHASVSSGESLTEEIRRGVLRALSDLPMENEANFVKVAVAPAKQPPAATVDPQARSAPPDKSPEKNGPMLEQKEVVPPPPPTETVPSTRDPPTGSCHVPRSSVHIPMPHRRDRLVSPLSLFSLRRASSDTITEIQMTTAAPTLLCLVSGLTSALTLVNEGISSTDDASDDFVSVLPSCDLTCALELQTFLPSDEAEVTLSVAERENLRLSTGRLLAAIRASRCSIVAILSRPAFGLQAEIALACARVRVAYVGTPSPRIGFPELAVGIVPSTATIHELTLRLGVQETVTQVPTMHTEAIVLDSTSTASLNSGGGGARAIRRAESTPWDVIPLEYLNKSSWREAYWSCLFGTRAAVDPWVKLVMEAAFSGGTDDPSARERATRLSDEIAMEPAAVVGRHVASMARHCACRVPSTPRLSWDVTLRRFGDLSPAALDQLNTIIVDDVLSVMDDAGGGSARGGGGSVRGGGAPPASDASSSCKHNDSSGDARAEVQRQQQRNTLQELVASPFLGQGVQSQCNSFVVPMVAPVDPWDSYRELLGLLPAEKTVLITPVVTLAQLIGGSKPGDGSSRGRRAAICYEIRPASGSTTTASIDAATWFVNHRLGAQATFCSGRDNNGRATASPSVRLMTAYLDIGARMLKCTLLNGEATVRAPTGSNNVEAALSAATTTMDKELRRAGFAVSPMEAMIKGDPRMIRSMATITGREPLQGFLDLGPASATAQVTWPELIMCALANEAAVMLSDGTVAVHDAEATLDAVSVASGLVPTEFGGVSWFAASRGWRFIADSLSNENERSGCCPPPNAACRRLAAAGQDWEKS